jgi:hypothetical protein
MSIVRRKEFGLNQIKHKERNKERMQAILGYWKDKTSGSGGSSMMNIPTLIVKNTDLKRERMCNTHIDKNDKIGLIGKNGINTPKLDHCTKRDQHFAFSGKC